MKNIFTIICWQIVGKVAKQKSANNWISTIYALTIVDPQGFEPQMTAPKTVVLPLHHRSVLYCGANLELFSELPNLF